MTQARRLPSCPRVSPGGRRKEKAVPTVCRDPRWEGSPAGCGAGGPGITGTELAAMEASTWQSCGYLRDDTSQARGRDCATSRAASAVACQDYTLLQQSPRGQEGLGHLPQPAAEAHVPAGAPMSGSSDEGAARAARGRGEEGEAPPKVYEMQVGHRWPGSSRTVKPVVYRLEESEYRRLLQEAEAEPDEEWEAEYEVPVLQESYPGNGKVASPSLKRINALQGALRGQLSRSDSESSLENRQVSRAAPSCPAEGNKPSVPIRSDSFERNALLMDYILQSKQEAAAAVSHVPRDGGKAAEGFRQALGFAPPPGGTPDPCQNGEEDAVRKPEVDWQVAKSLERMVSAAAAARDAGKLSRQNSSQLLESREWLEEIDLEMLDSYSMRKTPPAPPVRSHSKESLALSMSKTVALTEALLEPCSSLAKPAKEQRAAAGECGAEQPAGGRAPGGGGPEEQERKGRKSQEEDEKVLKVADAKKTFEKAKAAEGKAAASSARKAP